LKIILLNPYMNQFEFKTFKTENAIFIMKYFIINIAKLLDIVVYVVIL
jgi:hypothetical protein